MGVNAPIIAGDYGLGFKNAILINGVPLVMSHPGETFWVDENANHTGRGTFKNPDTTIQAGINRCVDGRGDLVFVKPGHVESITLTTEIVLDCVGVGLIGLGRGDDQAQITCTEVDGWVDVTAKNCMISGMWFECGYADQEIGVNVTAGAHHFQFVGNRVHSPSASLEYVLFLNIEAAADFLVVAGNDMRAFVGSGGASWIKTIGESIGITITDNIMIGPMSAGAMDLNATAITGQPLFARNIVCQPNDFDTAVAINSGTAATFIDERYAIVTSTEPVVDDAASHFAGCRGSDIASLGDLMFPLGTVNWT
jgi:hypothetical protein